MTEAVLFDVDGTLVDTSYLHTVAWWQAVRQYGHEVAMATIHRAIGMGSDRILDALLDEDRDRADDDRIRQAHGALYAPYRERLRPQRGATDLVRACDSRGLKVALASSASPPEFAALRRALDLDDVLDAATDAGDAESSKPDPDILQAALDRLGVPATRAVLVGDAVWDVYAAAGLDMPCIGLTCGGISAAELREAGAVQVFADPQDLLDHLDESIQR